MTPNNKNISIDRSQGTQIKSKVNMAQQMFSVKEVCEQTGLTRKQLFDYKKIVTPSDFNKSGYKLYDLEAIEKLKIISKLRDIDMSLKMIQKVIDGSVPKEVAVREQVDVLNKRKQEIGRMLDLAMEMLCNN